MSNDVFTAILQSHPFSKGFWPDHIARLTAMATRYAGEVLGWWSVTGTADGRQFQARSLEEVHALACEEERLRLACEDDYAFGFWFMGAILKVMADRMPAIRARLVDVYSPVAAVQ
jgi:hypothetical protein